MKIYVVMGESGMYDDNENWIVCAFTSQIKAKNRREKAQKVADDLYKRKEKAQKVAKETGGKNKYDKNMKLLLGGILYKIRETELI